MFPAIVVIALFLTIPDVNSFNIDVHIPIIKQGPSQTSKNTYFGFSVSPHKIAESQSFRMLVGAPLDNMTNHMSGEHPSGALYSCPITMAARDCHQILMLKPMRQYGIKNIHKQQWLGVNVHSDTVHGRGSFAYTCGHRFRIQDTKTRRMTAPGICMAIPNGLVSSGRHRLVVLRPDLCKSRSGSIQDSFCMRGTALAARPDLDIVAIGAANEQKGAGVTHFARFGRGVNRARIRFREVSARADVRSSNAGYSVALGRILKGTRVNFTLVSGAPGLPSAAARLSTLQWRRAVTGQVALFGIGNAANRRHRLAASLPPTVLPGEAFGSRFGHALLVIDLNNDGWDDLLVGAPDYEEERKIGAQPSHVRGSGAVYLFMNKVANARGERELKLEHRLRPRLLSRSECARTSCSSASFGSSLAALGDLNFDRFPDVAIGAPGEGNGAVYIYHGDRARGLSTVPAQVILASQLNSALRGFGASVSGGLDLDKNLYPDLVVGAPFSGHAVILRSRPVLEVVSSVIFVPAELDPGLQPSSAGLYDCPPDGRCLEAKVYLTYRHAAARNTGKESYKEIYSGEISIELDEEKSSEEPRVVFKNGGGRSLRRKVKFRHVKVAAKEPVFSLKLFINPKAFLDKLTPISLRLSWVIQLLAPDPKAASPSKMPNMSQFPVFNAALANRTFKLPWRPSCSSKPICLSDLNFQLRTTIERNPNQFDFLLGREDNFWLNFSISNVNEEAHMTFLFLDFSYRLALLETKCPFPCDLKNGLLRCPIANPLPQNTRRECRVHLSGSDVTPDTRRLNFSAWLTTVSKNVGSGTTKMNFSANVKILADIQLSSVVTPEMVVYKNRKVIGAAVVTHEDKIGPAVSFTLSLKNAAPSGMVPSSHLTIRWPFEMAGDLTENNGQFLLYLLEAPRLEAARNDSLRCDRAAYEDIVNANFVRLSARNASALPFAGKKLPELRSGLRYGRRFELCADGLARCRVIRCRVGLLSNKTGTIRLRFEARVWSHTLVQNFPDNRFVRIPVNVTWEPDARYSVEQINKGNTAIAMELVASSLMPLPLLPPSNLWLFLPLAFAGGFALFGLIVLVLRKLNFFRRDKRELEQRLAELQERREEEKHKYEYMEYD